MGSNILLFVKKINFPNIFSQKMMTNKCRMRNMYFWNSTIECGCKQFRPKHQVKIWTLKFFFQRQQINCENELLQVQLAQKKLKNLSVRRFSNRIKFDLCCWTYLHLLQECRKDVFGVWSMVSSPMTVYILVIKVFFEKSGPR